MGRLNQVSIDLVPDVKIDWDKELTDKEWLEQLAKFFIPPVEALENDHPEGVVQLKISATLCNVIGNKLLEIASRMQESKVH